MMNPSPDDPSPEAPAEDLTDDPLVTPEMLPEPHPSNANTSRSGAHTPSTKPPLNHAPAGEPAAAGKEKDVIYVGSVSMWMGWRSFLGSGMACVMGLTAFLIGLESDGVLIGKSLKILGLALVFAGGLMIPYLILSIRCLRYKITASLIEREKGLIIKRVDSMDLARVKDVELRQNLFQRLLRIGTIEIYASDRTDPSMLIEDLPNPRPIYENLRNAVIQLSQRRGVISMDQ